MFAGTVLLYVHCGIFFAHPTNENTKKMIKNCNILKMLKGIDIEMSSVSVDAKGRCCPQYQVFNALYKLLKLCRSNLDFFTLYIMYIKYCIMSNVSYSSSDRPNF